MINWSRRIKYEVLQILDNWDKDDDEYGTDNYIKEKQKIMDVCVQDKIINLIESIERTASTTSDEYMTRFEQEEFANCMRILSEVRSRCPEVVSIGSYVHKPNYIWESDFIEDISYNREYKDKWYNSPIKGGVRDFKHDNIFFDECSPFFSFIYKIVVYTIYAEYLQKRIAFRKKLKKAGEILTWLEQVVSKTSIADMKEEPINGKVNTKSKKKSKKDSSEYTFKHSLTDAQIEILTKCINEEKIFRTKEIISKEIIKSIFDCDPQIILKASCNRLLVYLFDQLYNFGYITENWQVVIANNKLFEVSRMDRFMDQNDLSVALHAINTIDVIKGKYEKILNCLKRLKKLSEQP